jgi:hypothetical protein
MNRLSLRTIKAVLYGVAATVTWLLTTVYYLLAASR